jgi:hypothetical protein
VAARVREIMADKAQWTGSASDLLLAAMLTVLTQNSRSSSGQEIAAVGARFDHSQSMNEFGRGRSARRDTAASIPARLTGLLKSALCQ